MSNKFKSTEPAFPNAGTVVDDPDSKKSEGHDKPHAEEKGEKANHAHEAGDGHEGDAHHGEHDYLDPGHLFAHVADQTYFEVPGLLAKDRKLEIPQYFTLEEPLTKEWTIFKPLDLQVTKFMILIFVGCVIVGGMLTWLGSHLQRYSRARGTLANMLEAMVVFIRDDLAKPAIGSKSDTEKFLPFLGTLFFFILTLNLIGMVPGLGAATGALSVTVVLALITFAVVIGAGISRFGVTGFLKNQVPHMDLPLAIAVVLIPALWVIEIFGLFVKHFVLAVRLFANMLAGHVVLAVFIAFIGVTYTSALVYTVAPLSIFAVVAISILELLVAFLQAYVFTFLAALFIGTSLHPH